MKLETTKVFQDVARGLGRVGIGVLLLAALVSMLPIPSSNMEAVYTRGVYPVIAALLIPLTALLPFSIAFVGLIALPILALILFVRSRKGLRPKQNFWGVAARVGLTLLCVYGAFQLLWGLNYRRESIETLLELNTAPVTPVELETVARDLLKVVRDNATATRDSAAAISSLRNAIRDTVQSITGSTPTLPAQVKSPPAGWLIALRTSGVVSPLTLEAHVDPGLPEPFFVAVSAHELTHLTGSAGEADTDLIAAISGLRASDGYARYCVALNYFMDVYAELPAKTRAALGAELPAVARNDWNAYIAALRRYKLPDAITNVTQGAYSGYLQSQGVSAGIRDYSRIVTLLARLWRKE
jgi:Protein of unknown function (DUF3810)